LDDFICELTIAGGKDIFNVFSVLLISLLVTGLNCAVRFAVLVTKPSGTSGGLDIFGKSPNQGASALDWKSVCPEMGGKGLRCVCPVAMVFRTFFRSVISSLSIQ
jgi:hypothetical protein